MTREEAIANLKMIGVAFVEPVTKEQRKLIDDTFGMAISALEQTETWNGFHGQITVPKGTFKKIWDDCNEQEPCEDAIVSQMVQYIKAHDTPSLIELVIKAIKESEG